MGLNKGGLLNKKAGTHLENQHGLFVFFFFWLSGSNGRWGATGSWGIKKFQDYKLDEDAFSRSTEQFSATIFVWISSSLISGNKLGLRSFHPTQRRANINKRASAQAHLWASAAAFWDGSFPKRHLQHHRRRRSRPLPCSFKTKVRTLRLHVRHLLPARQSARYWTLSLLLCW